MNKALQIVFVLMISVVSIIALSACGNKNNNDPEPEQETQEEMLQLFYNAYDATFNFDGSFTSNYEFEIETFENGLKTNVSNYNNKRTFNASTNDFAETLFCNIEGDFEVYDLAVVKNGDDYVCYKKDISSGYPVYEAEIVGQNYVDYYIVDEYNSFVTQTSGPIDLSVDPNTTIKSEITITKENDIYILNAYFEDVVIEDGAYFVKTEFEAKYNDKLISISAVEKTLDENMNEAKYHSILHESMAFDYAFDQSMLPTNVEAYPEPTKYEMTVWVYIDAIGFFDSIQVQVGDEFKIPTEQFEELGLTIEWYLDEECTKVAEFEKFNVHGLKLYGKLPTPEEYAYVEIIGILHNDKEREVVYFPIEYEYPIEPKGSITYFDDMQVKVKSVKVNGVETDATSFALQNQKSYKIEYEFEYVSLESLTFTEEEKQEFAKASQGINAWLDNLGDYIFESYDEESGIEIVETFEQDTGNYLRKNSLGDDYYVLPNDESFNIYEKHINKKVGNEGEPLFNYTSSKVENVDYGKLFDDFKTKYSFKTNDLETFVSSLSQEHLSKNQHLQLVGCDTTIYVNMFYRYYFELVLVYCNTQTNELETLYLCVYINSYLKFSLDYNDEVIEDLEITEGYRNDFLDNLDKFPEIED